MNKTIYSTLVLFTFACFTSETALAAPVCSQSKMTELLTGTDGAIVDLDCDLTLSSTDVVKKLITITKNFDNDALTINCNNALIDLTHAGAKEFLIYKEPGSSEIPSNIVIKNCRINGNMRMRGFANIGQDQSLHNSSQTAGHTQRAQDNAPNNITLDNITLLSDGKNTLYLASGVHHVTVKNSSIKNSGGKNLAVYLDSESAYNTFTNNALTVSGPYNSSRREIMAIDSSAYNTIQYNTFSGLHRGGVYLYRNCGEDGTVRHQTPSYNKIKKNYFIYQNYYGDNPAVWVSNRNGNKSYCSYDISANLPNTSSTDDKDNATYNQIQFNQFLNRDPDDYINYGTVANSNPNDLNLNRPQYSYGNISTPQFKYGAVPTTHNFECQVTGNNSGCNITKPCATGKVNATVRAACNLEYGTITSADYPRWGELSVKRPSDVLSHGQCTIDQTTIQSGKVYIGGSSQNSIYVQCKEFDNNGGDCHIKGQQICY